MHLWPLVTGGDQRKGLEVKSKGWGIENMARTMGDIEQWLWQLLGLENQQCHVLAPGVVPMWGWWGNMRTGSSLWAGAGNSSPWGRNQEGWVRVQCPTEQGCPPPTTSLHPQQAPGSPGAGLGFWVGCRG